MRILITGGRGTLGRLLVPRLQAAGHDVVVTSRSAGGDAPGGAEVRALDFSARELPDGLLDDIDVLIPAATDPMRTKSVDVGGTQRLVEGAARAGVSHVLFLSIVGIDDHPYPYYRAKLAAERIIEAGEVPSTILRATQFHEFLARIFATGPVVMTIRDVAFQVIDGGAVADRMVELVEAGPSGRVDDLGGPEAIDMRELATTWKDATGGGGPIVSLPVWGRSVAAFRAGQHHTPNRATGTPTWAQWLARHA